MRYLTFGQILFIHSLMIDAYGGSHGLRDREAILSLEALPKQKAFGQELYPTVFDKAAVYIRSIIMNHPFVDGNKRTGMTAAAVFLENNGYEFVAERGEIVALALKVATTKLDIPAIAKWLKRLARERK